MRMYHIGMESAGRYAILPGDPGRCEQIASYLDDPREIAFHREYHSYAGTLDGALVNVVSTGIGGPSTAICVEELHKLGTDTFIRVGTCGGMQLNVAPGDIVIASAAVRAEGTSREYMPIEYPAAADFTVTSALAQAARLLKITHHVGVVQCKDSFYGQHEPDRMPISARLSAQWQAWKAAGCIASEMESAAMFILSSVLGARAGSVFLTAGNQEREAAGIREDNAADTAPAIKTAIEALRTLIAHDNELL